MSRPTQQEGGTQASSGTSSLQALAAASGAPMVLRADKPSSGLSGGLRHTNHSHHNSNSASPDGEAVLQLPPLALKGRLASLKTSSRGNLVASKRAALRHLPLLCFLSILVLAPMSLWGSFIQMHTSSARGAVSHWWSWCDWQVEGAWLWRLPAQCIHSWSRPSACSTTALRGQEDSCNVAAQAASMPEQSWLSLVPSSVITVTDHLHT